MGLAELQLEAAGCQANQCLMDAEGRNPMGHEPDAEGVAGGCFEKSNSVGVV